MYHTINNARRTVFILMLDRYVWAALPTLSGIAFSVTQPHIQVHNVFKYNK